MAYPLRVTAKIVPAVAGCGTKIDLRRLLVTNDADDDVIVKTPDRCAVKGLDQTRCREILAGGLLVDNREALAAQRLRRDFIGFRYRPVDEQGAQVRIGARLGL